MAVENITPTELKAKLDAGEDLVVIDVRNQWELDISSVDFANHIVLNELPDRMDEVPEDKPVVLMCRSGGRSMQAANFLAANGYENLINLQGGILGWAQDVDPSLPQDY